MNILINIGWFFLYWLVLYSGILFMLYICFLTVNRFDFKKTNKEFDLLKRKDEKNQAEFLITIFLLAGIVAMFLAMFNS